MASFSNKKDIKILVNVKNNDLTVNALQSKASVVIQKSIREGFALTISEAAYKSTPVVASNIGGMPLQIINNESGYLHDPLDYKSFADSIVKILKDKKLAKRLGEKSRMLAGVHDTKKIAVKLTQIYNYQGHLRAC